MSLPIYPTLVELRNQVLLRCGYSNDGNQSAGIAPMVDSIISGSEHELLPELQWIKAVKQTSITLTAGVQAFDWPDDAEPGKIQMVWVKREDSGELSEVMPGIHLNERDSSERGEDGRPLLYEDVDETLYLYPAPSADYTTLYIQYLVASNLTQENNRCIVDPELLIQRATMKLKEYLGLPIGQMEMANHERYLARMKSSNSSKDGFVLGGHKSWRTQVQKNNRVARDRQLGHYYEYTNDWNPW